LALKIFKTRTWIVRLWNQTLVRNWRFENIWYSKEKTSVISFNRGIHPYDIGTIIDKLGIAVRTGHHCAQPIMTFRYSRNNTSFFFFYNTKEEIDVMVEAVKRALMLS
jgi:cysteine desulfurase/selenocysteine lyase